VENLQYLLDGNLAWATEIKEKDPDFFTRLSQQKAPKYLWIGCSDSTVAANQIIDLEPGEFLFIGILQMWLYILI